MKFISTATAGLVAFAPCLSLVAADQKSLRAGHRREQASGQTFPQIPSGKRNRVAYLGFLGHMSTVAKKRQKDPAKKRLQHQRIVGGHEVNKAGAYEYFVQWDTGCGGTLIHPDIVLSAAHCSDDPFSRTVWIGSHNYQEGETRTIVSRKSHPNYDRYSEDYDYVLLKLNEPVDEVTPVRLAQSEEDDPEDGDPLTVIGFGAVSEWDFYDSETLQEVTVNSIPHQQCHEQYLYGWPSINRVTMLCAGTEEGEKDTCAGDSGGPLLNANGTQVGITSWGAGCGDPSFPGIYSRVSAAYDWIQTEICRMSNYPPSDCDSSITRPPATVGAVQGNISLTLTVKLDEFPGETAFAFSNVNSGQELVFHDYESLYESNELISETFHNLGAGTYSFIIGDSSSDGICCGFGHGNVKLTNAASGIDIWTHNGFFTSSLEATLEINDSGELISSAVVPPEVNVNEWGFEAGNYTLIVDLMFDSFPNETRLELLYEDTYAYIDSIDGYDYDPKTIVYQAYDHLPSGIYAFDIYDDGYDGGTAFEIRSKDRNEEEVVLFVSDGNYYNHLHVDIPLW